MVKFLDYNGKHEASVRSVMGQNALWVHISPDPVQLHACVIFPSLIFPAKRLYQGICSQISAWITQHTPGAEGEPVMCFLFFCIWWLFAIFGSCEWRLAGMLFECAPKCAHSGPAALQCEPWYYQVQCCQCVIGWNTSKKNEIHLASKTSCDHKNTESFSWSRTHIPHPSPETARVTVWVESGGVAQMWLLCTAHKLSISCGDRCVFGIIVLLDLWIWSEVEKLW